MNYQLSRRCFIQVLGATALSQILIGCSNAEATLQVLFLAYSIPQQLITDFRRTTNETRKVKFRPQTQIGQIFDFLYNLKQSKKSANKNQNITSKFFSKSVVYPRLTTLGDAWLSSAIKQNLIQPLSVDNLANWQKLPASWHKLSRRNNLGNLSDDGQIYGAPYRWGSTVIAYRSDKLSSPPTDWADLWQPELRDRLSLLDSPREVIGLTLKKLGLSYNTNDLDSVTNLEAELLALHRQAKLYSYDHYLEPLIIGDTWAAVAWSTDIIPLLQRYPEIKFVIPQSGTSLWADLWVKPQISQASTVEPEADSEIIEAWIDYCWQPQAAKQISLFTDGISPILSTLEPSEIPLDLQENVFLNSAVLQSDKSEFLYPLNSQTEQQYRDLWLKIRQSE